MKSETEKKVPKIRKPRSTTVMLWRNFTLFTVGVIVVVALVCYGVLGSAFFSRAKRLVSTVGEEISVIVNDPSVPSQVTEAKINDYALINGLDVFLLDLDGNTIIPFGYVEPEGWSGVVEDMIRSAGEWEQDKTVVYNSSTGKRGTLNFVSCVNYGGTPCRLLVRYPLAALTDSVSRMQLYVLLIALASIIVVFFLSYLIAEKLSRPLRDMSQTAKKLAAGDFGVQFTSVEYAEIANLSDALNHMKDELKKSGDFQKELLANVSHDLKTPLTMIKAYASMIREISGDDPEKRDKHLQVIIDESDRLTGLVNDVLCASKISSGLAQLNKKVFNLTEYLYSVIDKFGYLQETQGYKIMVDVDANLYTLADEEKIGQVIYNLISNAVNYTGEDKTVYISLKYAAEEDRIKFSVRDTGKGISEEELEHIWDRYYRSKDSHTRPVKGTGLGLNIVKAILDSHAFAFGVKSQDGKGSTFYVDFPAVQPLAD